MNMRIWLGACRLLLVLSVLTGLIYPSLITLFAQTAYRHRANGGVVREAGRIVGVELVAQKFGRPQYLWARASAVDFNPLPSGASNLGPTSKALKEAVAAREGAGLVGGLKFASASGLDPHISPSDARHQLPRIQEARRADKRGLTVAELEALVDRLTEGAQFGFLGEPRVNVLLFNLELDRAVRKAP